MDRNEMDMRPPWERPAEPEHPLVVEGGVIDGDTRLMAVCLFEEMLRHGMSVAELRRLTHDPHYQALHAIRATLGPEETDRLLAQTGARVGVLRWSHREAAGDDRPAALTVSARPRRSNTRSEG